MVLYLPRDAESVPVSRQVLDGCLETLGVTADTRTDIALALSEACANVVLHAGPGDEYEAHGEHAGRAVRHRGGEHRQRRHGDGSGQGGGGLPRSDPLPGVADTAAA